MILPGFYIKSTRHIYYPLDTSLFSMLSKRRMYKAIKIFNFRNHLPARNHTPGNEIITDCMENKFWLCFLSLGTCSETTCNCHVAGRILEHIVYAAIFCNLLCYSIHWPTSNIFAMTSFFSSLNENVWMNRENHIRTSIIVRCSWSKILAIVIMMKIYFAPS